MGFDAISGPNFIVPTPPAGDSSHRVADTAFVANAIAVPVLAFTTASLVGDVSLTSTTTYFDGPSVAQGTTGTWFASGTVTLLDTAGAAAFYAVLWDGTTTISDVVTNSNGASSLITISLSGYLASPAANIRISVKDANSASGLIKANVVNSKGKNSTITAFRIG